MTTSMVEGVLSALVPYWAAEGEICRAHFDQSHRSFTVEADWLGRQAAKELHDGVEPRVERVRIAVAANAPAGLIARETQELHEEASHFASFAAAHDVVAAAAGLPILTHRDLAELASWPENDTLRAIRAEHHRANGSLGDVATTLTEGGCASLFAAGVNVAVDSAVDRAIVDACRAVLDDEMVHLGSGFADIAAGLEAVDLDLLVAMAVEQSVARLHMRQAQFGHPVPVERFAELLEGSASHDDCVEVRRRLNGSITS